MNLLDINLTFYSSMVRALVCQPSGPGSNPGGNVQISNYKGEPIQLLPTITIYFCNMLIYDSHIDKYM